MKKNILFLVVFAFFTLILSVQAQDEPTSPRKSEAPYAVTGEPLPKTLYAHSFASPSSLYTVNFDSGIPTLVGSIQYDGVTDIAFKDNLLYGTTFNSFISIDPSTGIGTFIGNLGFSSINALAVSGSGIFYAASTDGTFIRIDPDTGKGYFIGKFGTGLSSSGDMAFDPENGILYAAINVSSDATDWLGTINLQNGTAALIGDLNHSSVWGISYYDNQLYGVTSNGITLKINPQTGATTSLNDSIVSFGGMTTSPDAFPVFDLPYDYSSSTFFQESKDDQLPGGRISSYFDHEYPTYCNGPNKEAGNGCTPTDYRAVNFYGYDGGNLIANQPPYNVTYNGHDGIDFSLAESTQVLAAASGKVIVVKSLGDNSNDNDRTDDCLGAYVVVEHSNGYQTIYGHLSGFAPGLKPNITILTRNSINDQNALLGYVGNTGCSTNPHLHFSVKNADNIVIDPYGWSPKSDSAYFGKPDPWQLFNANLGKDGESQYLWHEHLNETKVTDPNSSTWLISPSNEVYAWFPNNISLLPLRVELAESLQPSYVNGLPALRSFFIMAYQDDIVPINSLNNEFSIYYQPQVLGTERSAGSSVSELENYKVFLWNTATEGWIEIPVEYDTTNNLIMATSAKLGTFAVVNQKSVFLPLLLKP